MKRIPLAAAIVAVSTLVALALAADLGPRGWRGSTPGE